MQELCTKFKIVEVDNQDIIKKPVEKFIHFFKKINGEVVKYSSVCIGPYIRDIKRKYTRIKECNNSEVNNEEATSNKKEKKDVLRNLYCTNCQFITKFNPSLNIHAMFLHYKVEYNIKIEDQIQPNIGRLAKVFDI